MTPESIKAVVEIFDGLGADARYIVVAVIGFMVLRALLLYAFLTFLVIAVTRLIGRAIVDCSLVKGFQRDLGYVGELVDNERNHIVKVWKKGLGGEK